MDAVDKIMQYEAGEMDEQQAVDFFQELINSGLAWELQGTYGRMALALINAGRCTQAGTD